MENRPTLVIPDHMVKAFNEIMNKNLRPDPSDPANQVRCILTKMILHNPVPFTPWTTDAVVASIAQELADLLWGYKLETVLIPFIEEIINRSFDDGVRHAMYKLRAENERLRDEAQ